MAVAPSALGELIDVFEQNFRSRGEIGASISVWWQGVELISHGHGWRQREQISKWDDQTCIPVYSATKGPSAAALLHALDQHGLSVETPVHEVWPRFPILHATFAQLLSHQCGLAALDHRANVWDHDECIAAIEAQTPAWFPGDGHGYHPRTFGPLLDEPVRRLTGCTLGDWWRKMIAAPLNLDFWIGLPPSESSRVAKLYPGKADKSDLADGFYLQFNTEGSLTRRAFTSPRGLHAVQEMNHPMAWSAGFPAMGGVGTASALAKFYQAAIGAIESPLTPQVRGALATLQVSGADRVLLKPTAFTCGCQKDPLEATGTKSQQLYGPSTSAFGHPGAGGSHAFGDPENGISFAYVMNQMEMAVMPGIKCREMIQALYSHH